MNRNIKFLALDLDGTLTDSEKKVTARTKAAIRKAQGAGVQIILASGRPLIGMNKIIDELDLRQTGGYALAYNGGQIVDLASGRDLVRLVVPEKYYKEIAELSRRYPVGILSYNHEGVISENADNPYVRKEAFNDGVPCIAVDDLPSAMESEESKLMMVGEPEELQKAFPYVKEKFGSDLNVFFSESYFVEIVPQGIEKARGLQSLLDILGYDREVLMACGDGFNDIPMLRYAGFSVAMGNAYDEAKAVCDVTVGTNDEDGVAEAIYRYILEEPFEQN